MLACDTRRVASLQISVSEGIVHSVQGQPRQLAVRRGPLLFGMLCAGVARGNSMSTLSAPCAGPLPCCGWSSGTARSCSGTLCLQQSTTSSSASCPSATRARCTCAEARGAWRQRRSSRSPCWPVGARCALRVRARPAGLARCVLLQGPLCHQVRSAGADSVGVLAGEGARRAQWPAAALPTHTRQVGCCGVCDACRGRRTPALQAAGAPATPVQAGIDMRARRVYLLPSGACFCCAITQEHAQES